MIALMFILLIIVFAIVSVAILRLFDRIAGRGPKQIADGIEMARKRAE